MGIFDEVIRNKYLPLVPTDKSKEIIRKYEELWTKIRNVIRSKTDNSDDYEEKYTKIRFNSDYDLPQR